MRFAIHVRPGARHDHVGGARPGRNGPALVVSVQPRAVDGAANTAVVAAVADAFGVRRADVSIVSGHRGRDKIVEVVGGDPALLVRLRDG
ncbi:DUF167 domain-containing protein [Pseudonocardia sp. CA-107938]|uniref:DUF167 domain-containing protein n=1 Tax=Pseudonocardia sp. CA-107938 TaxID=3240021 RepID=UPI003D8D91CE